VKTIVGYVIGAGLIGFGLWCAYNLVIAGHWFFAICFLVITCHIRVKSSPDRIEQKGTKETKAAE
jgi:hypothetical protein